MLVTPDYRIQRLIVNGQDQSILTFRFDNEKLNPPVDDVRFKFEMPAGSDAGSRGRRLVAEFVLKYADPRGEVHQQVAEAATERDLRERYSQQGFLVYSIKPRHGIAGMAVGGGRARRSISRNS